MGAEAVVRVTANADGYVSAMERARKSGVDFITGQEAIRQRLTNSVAAIDAARQAVKAQGDEALASFNKSARTAERWLTQLQRQASEAGKTREELMRLRAAELGVSSAAERYIAQIESANTAHRKLQEGVGMSAAAMNAAMRMVPAQMTDVVTQLAGGQSPLLILTQQGGQLKDMFGGVVPAVRAVGTYLVGLINPLTVAAAAFGALTYAVSSGAGEQRAFSQALVMTGNYAGVTADQMSSMARRVSQSIGTQAKAAEVLAQIAATGKIAGDQMQAIAVAAETMQKATGAAVDDTIGKFVQLAEEPVRASVKLNEQYHYLTLSVYKQIAALEEQGNKDQAAAVAQQAYAEEMKRRADKVLENLGYLERGWNAVMGAAKGAWDAMLGLGRAATLDEIKGKISQTQQQLAALESGSGFETSGGGAALGAGVRGKAAQIARLRADLQQLQAQAKPLEDRAAQEAVDGENRRRESEKVAAQTRLDAQKKATRSRAEIRQDEIDQLKRDAAATGMAVEEYQERLAAINAQYKDPKSAKPKAFQEDAATKFIEQIRQQDAAVRAALASSGKLTDAEKKQAEFTQLIAALKGKDVLSADQKSLLAAQDKVRAALDQYVADSKALKLKEDLVRLEERSAQIQEHIASYRQSQQEQYQRQLDAFGLGSEAQKQVEAVKSIYREFRHQQEQLTKATPESQIGGEPYLAKRAAIQAQLEASLKDYEAYYASLKAKQADWTNGATQAMADYRDYAANVADQTGRAFTGFFQGLEDSVVNFATTGKASFGDFARSVIADLARIQARAALSGLAQMGINVVSGMFGSAETWNGGVQGVTGAFTGSQATSIFYKAEGGLISGPGTGTSDSIPAMLSNGEFVVNAQATARNRGLLEAINGGAAPARFASGGYVGESAPALWTASPSNSATSGAGGGGGGAINVTVQTYLTEGGTRSQTGGDSSASARQLSEMISAAVTDRLNRERRQGGLLWKMQNGQ